MEEFVKIITIVLSGAVFSLIATLLRPLFPHGSAISKSIHAFYIGLILATIACSLLPKFQGMDFGILPILSFLWGSLSVHVLLYILSKKTTIFAESTTDFRFQISYLHYFGFLSGMFLLAGFHTFLMASISFYLYIFAMFISIPKDTFSEQRRFIPYLILAYPIGIGFGALFIYLIPASWYLSTLVYCLAAIITCVFFEHGLLLKDKNPMYRMAWIYIGFLIGLFFSI